MSIDIKNNGLTDNLYSIMDLLEKNAATYDDYNQLAQDFIEVLINAGIKCRAVQAEIILNRIIRNSEDLYSRPAFDKFENPKFKILKLKEALHATKAPTVGLSYQELKRQVLGDAIYDEKDGSSYLDPLYADKISTKRLREIAMKIREEHKENGKG